jgi:hypothetical protein
MNQHAHQSAGEKPNDDISAFVARAEVLGYALDTGAVKLDEVSPGVDELE